jgi:hypothetical protein
LRMKKWGDDVAVCFDFYESILFEIQFVWIELANVQKISE